MPFKALNCLYFGLVYPLPNHLFIHPCARLFFLFFVWGVRVLNWHTTLVALDLIAFKFLGCFFWRFLFECGERNCATHQHRCYVGFGCECGGFLTNPFFVTFRNSARTMILCKTNFLLLNGAGEGFEPQFTSKVLSQMIILFTDSKKHRSDELWYVSAKVFEPIQGWVHRDSTATRLRKNIKFSKIGVYTKSFLIILFVQPSIFELKISFYAVW